MGWKEYYRKTFESEVQNAQNWGDLAPYQVTVSGTTYDTVGVYSGSPTGYKFSPDIQHPQGVRTRIRIKYIFFVDAGATGKATLGIVYYKDGDTAKDPNGYDLHGVSHSLSTAPSSNLAEIHEFIMEYDGGNKITWYVDGKKLNETTLELPLTKFKVALAVDSASGGNVECS